MNHNHSDSPSLTGFLKALVIGGAVVISAATAQAAFTSKPVSADPQDNPDDSLESRVERVRKKLSETTLARDEAGSAAAEQMPADAAPLDEAKQMWWRNWGNWHNGNWPNWRNGWGNWGNGGWGNHGGRKGWWANF